MLSSPRPLLFLPFRFLFFILSLPTFWFVFFTKFLFGFDMLVSIISLSGTQGTSNNKPFVYVIDVIACYRCLAGFTSSEFGSIESINMYGMFKANFLGYKAQTSRQGFVVRLK